VTMMIIIFWEMTPCGSYKNRRFGGSYRLHLQGARVRAGYSASLCLYRSLQLRSVTRSHSCILKMEAIRSSETSVLIRATRCHLPEDDNYQQLIFSSFSSALYSGRCDRVAHLFRILRIPDSIIDLETSCFQRIFLWFLFPARQTLR
jgi:hypothetical protein